MIAVAVAGLMALFAVAGLFGRLVDRDAAGIVAGVLLLTATLNGLLGRLR